MSIFRTIAMFIYLFGYMIVHYGVLRRAERALAAGDTQLVEELVNKHIPHWSRGILKVTGVSLSVEGLENIPKDTPCVFVGNHRSYYDIPLLLASLDKPHGILAKEELEKIPLLNRWMKLLGCVFVQRDDLRASVRALNDATAIVESGKSFVIFPEGTRYKGEEGGAGEFKAGAFRPMPCVRPFWHSCKHPRPLRPLRVQLVPPFGFAIFPRRGGSLSKGEPLAKPYTLQGLPKPLTLGEVASR